LEFVNQMDLVVLHREPPVGFPTPARSGMAVALFGALQEISCHHYTPKVVGPRTHPVQASAACLA
jgi:hypothetical protein